MLGMKTPVLPLAIMILLVVPAEATTSYYAGAATEATFDGAKAGLTLLNPALTFSSGDLASGGLFNANGTGIDFLGFNSFVFNTPTNFTVVSGKLTATAAAQVVKVVFPLPGDVYALGFHFTVTSGNGFWCLDLNTTGCAYSINNIGAADIQFFGIVSDTPLTAPLYIRPSTGSPIIVITDFEAYTSSVPEPHTMLLVGLGLVTLRLTRWKKLRRGA